MIAAQCKAMASATTKGKMMKRNEKRPQGQWIRTDLRLAIYLRDEFHCVYCGKDLHGCTDPQELTLDHVAPWSKGGSNLPTNIITACRSCNCSRGARRLSSYADPSTVKAVKRQTKREIKKYRKIAKQILKNRNVEKTIPTKE
jgi:5-methylcytosine-specific restriction endonuclease McrA